MTLLIKFNFYIWSFAKVVPSFPTPHSTFKTPAIQHLDKLVAKTIHTQYPAEENQLLYRFCPSIKHLWFQKEFCVFLVKLNWVTWHFSNMLPEGQQSNSNKKVDAFSHPGLCWCVSVPFVTSCRNKQQLLWKGTWGRRMTVSQCTVYTHTQRFKGFRPEVKHRQETIQENGSCAYTCQQKSHTEVPLVSWHMESS